MSADGAAAIFRADKAVLLQSPDISVISDYAETPVTRAEAIAAIGQLFHADTNMTAASAQWTDVSADQDLTAYINWGSSLHLIYPRTDTEFAPNDTISTEDFIMILYRALNSAGLEPRAVGQAESWEDRQMISDYAADAIDNLSAAGILESGEDGKLRPGEPITQASAYQILEKTYQSLYEDLQEEVVFDDTAAIPEMTKLKEELEQELGRQSNNWAVYVKCLDTGQEIAVNDSHMCSASLIKLFVAGTYLQAIEDGTVRYGRRHFRQQRVSDIHDFQKQQHSLDRSGNRFGSRQSGQGHRPGQRLYPVAGLSADRAQAGRIKSNLFCRIFQLFNRLRSRRCAGPCIPQDLRIC